jgi:hypothetical protein
MEIRTDLSGGSPCQSILPQAQGLEGKLRLGESDTFVSPVGLDDIGLALVNLVSVCYPYRCMIFQITAKVQ